MPNGAPQNQTKQELVVKISELESKLAESEVNAKDLNEQISTKKAEAEEHALEQEKEREDLNENLTANAEQLRVAREHESKLEQGGPIGNCQLASLR